VNAVPHDTACNPFKAKYVHALALKFPASNLPVVLSASAQRNPKTKSETTACEAGNRQSKTKTKLTQSSASAQRCKSACDQTQVETGLAVCGLRSFAADMLHKGKRRGKRQRCVLMVWEREKKDKT
jgi:hypothetical protein